MIFKMFRTVTWLFLLAIIVVSCEDTDYFPTSSYDNFTADYQGIIITDAQGNLLGSTDDGSDWGCSGELPPGHGGSMLPRDSELHPAYPNPTNSTTTIEFSITEQAEVKVYVIGNNFRFSEIILEKVYPAGSHAFEWDATGLSPGIYRIFIEIRDAYCYGDVQVVK